MGKSKKTKFQKKYYFHEINRVLYSFVCENQSLKRSIDLRDLLEDRSIELFEDRSTFFQALVKTMLSNKSVLKFLNFFQNIFS